MCRALSDVNATELKECGIVIVLGAKLGNILLRMVSPSAGEMWILRSQLCRCRRVQGAERGAVFRHS